MSGPAAVWAVVAYELLPAAVAADPGGTLVALTESPDERVAEFHVEACGRLGVEPDPADRRDVFPYAGPLDDRRGYALIQYPDPPAAVAGERPAPLFSAVVEGAGCFVLAAVGGGTRLLAVTPSGTTDLGPGCAAEAGAVVALLRAGLTPAGEYRRRRPWWKWWTS